MSYLNKLLEVFYENKEEIENEMDETGNSLLIAYRRGNEIGLKMFSNGYESVDLLRSTAENHPIFRLQMETALSMVKTDKLLSLYEKACKELQEKDKRRD